MAASILPVEWGLLAGGLGAAVFFDLRLRRVPNWLTVSILVGGLMSRSFAGGWVELGLGVCGAAIGLVALLFPFARGWIGGGDVKLLAACGSWLGPQLIGPALLVSSLAGGGVAVLFLAFGPRALFREVVQNLSLVLVSRQAIDVPERSHAQSPPYALAIAFGTLYVLLVRGAEQIL